MINIPKLDDLYKIAEFLRENEFDSGNLAVVIYVKTQERLNRLNKDYYYKANPKGETPSDENVDNINIQIGNVTFTYKLQEQNENEE